MPRQALFDLAVAHALSYAIKLGFMGKKLSEKALYNGLELWYLKTRFAYRIPLDKIVAILRIYPNDNSQWLGGQNGSWQKQKTKAHKKDK